MLSPSLHTHRKPLIGKKVGTIEVLALKDAVVRDAPDHVTMTLSDQDRVTDKLKIDDSN
jgi:hypothetical protein